MKELDRADGQQIKEREVCDWRNPTKVEGQKRAQLWSVAAADIPEKFLVTSKVVNMAPCSDRREGRKEARKEERNSGFDKLAARKRSTVKGRATGVSPQGTGSRNMESPNTNDC